MSFLPLIIIFGVMYFLMIRPQQKKMKLQRALIESVKAGDEVVLNSGIFGVVSEVEGDVIWLEVAGDLELKVFKGAIDQRFTPPAEATESEIPEEDSPNEKLIYAASSDPLLHRDTSCHFSTCSPYNPVGK